MDLFTLSYQEQLQHSLWFEKREQILERDGYRCTELGCYSTIELHVHHKYYDQSLLAWQYPDEALTTLCSKHHLAKHKKHQANGKVKFLANRRDFFKQKALQRIANRKNL